MKFIGLTSGRLFIYGSLFTLGILLPFIVRSEYSIHLLILCCIWIMMTTGYNLLYGYTGALSFGHAAFIAIGAYTSTLLVMNFNVPWPLGMLSGGVMAAIIAALIGIPVLRLTGVYFAFVTIGFGEVTRLTIKNWESLTGGPYGIIEVPPMFESLTLTYIFVFLVMMFVFLVTHRIVHSRIGRAFIAIRENRDLAESIGINVANYRLLAYVLSAFFCGVGGAMMVHYLGYCYPELASIFLSVNLVLYTIIGGPGTLLGPTVAAFLFTLFPELFRFIGDYKALLYGVILVVVIIFAPRGLEPILRSLFSVITVRLKSMKVAKAK